MSALTFSRLPENDLLYRHGIPEATLGETLSAILGDVASTPTGLLLRQGEIETADGPMMDPAELNARFGHLGLEFDAPMSLEAARLIADGKREEIARNDIIARGPQGLGAGAAQFAAGIARQAMDPINLGTAFIPAFGTARWGSLALRIGRQPARVARGFAQGALGNAAIEPAMLYLSKQQQLDYSVADALLNVAFGGIVGGGAHFVPGAVAAGLRRLRPETRAEAFKAAIAQTMSGRTVDVDPVIRADAGSPDRPVLVPETRNGKIRRFNTIERARERQSVIRMRGGEAEVRQTRDGDWLLYRRGGEVLRSVSGQPRTFASKADAERAITGDEVAVPQPDGSFVLVRGIDKAEFETEFGIEYGGFSPDDIPDVRSIAQREASPERDALHEPDQPEPLPEADDLARMNEEVDEGIERLRAEDLPEADAQALADLEEFTQSVKDAAKAVGLLRDCQKRNT